MSCDLLSKLYLWHIENSEMRWILSYVCVVICFQNCIFDISKTVLFRMTDNELCCDLLSKLYLWHIENSCLAMLTCCRVVVICFQNCIFDISKTVRTFVGVNPSQLWFAFKIVSLTYRKQCVYHSCTSFPRCDLLSKLYLWHIENSRFQYLRVYPLVVICFQNCIFDISKTVQTLYCAGNQRIRMSVRKEKSLCFR